MTNSDTFDPAHFTPYLLAIAAEQAGEGFQKHYKARYGMLRNEWRVLFHLGRYGSMTAKEICCRGRLHKTKVSRAVAALEKKRWLKRVRSRNDRRCETLSLTKAGLAVYADLSGEAVRYDTSLLSGFSNNERMILRQCLSRIADMSVAS